MLVYCQKNVTLDIDKIADKEDTYKVFFKVISAYIEAVAIVEDSLDWMRGHVGKWQLSLCLAGLRRAVYVYVLQIDIATRLCFSMIIDE